MALILHLTTHTKVRYIFAICNKCLPLQLTIHHYHGWHAHTHQYKCINYGLPNRHARRENRRKKHKHAE